MPTGMQIQTRSRIMTVGQHDNCYTNGKITNKDEDILIVAGEGLRISKVFCVYEKKKYLFL
jgi:hypothetical protein